MCISNTIIIMMIIIIIQLFYFYFYSYFIFSIQVSMWVGRYVCFCVCTSMCVYVCVCIYWPSGLFVCLFCFLFFFARYMYTHTAMSVYPPDEWCRKLCLGRVRSGKGNRPLGGTFGGDSSFRPTDNMGQYI